ncbi:hypothetical protein [Halobellus rarus]|uniref:Uncharacterized protein n=1 Tax=Halobellus rarus TaxID=1126237 RepID=A0ABD6CPR8_9EURY|nr:hypothetical protein [Halobellus rarus]
MTDSDLRRSVRRSAAVLLVPLSLLLIQIEVVTRNLPGVVESSLPGISRGIGLVLLIVALLYLLVSGARQLYRAADTPF